MSIETYADFLASQGESVVEISGLPWMKYRGALISATAMPVYVKPSHDEALKVLVKSRALFLRYTTEPEKPETNWWHMICRQYDFKKLSSNTRSKIRRGIKRTDIKQVSPDWLANAGHDCHIKCYTRYKCASPMSKNGFQSFLLSLKGHSIFDIWACLISEQLQGYIICLRENNGVFMHTIDITPMGLRDYAAYAMIHRLLEYYVNEKRIPVSNGSRSISHATDMQDFLRKLGFEREYAELNVIYRPDIKLIVNFLYPFRNFLKKLDMIPLCKMISSVLFQETIVRARCSEQL